ncbi:MAG: hypothetical protein QHH09_02555 [Microgenomates group bacterium]|nr:hypothetical protein [Microgenomates group bacterium]
MKNKSSFQIIILLLLALLLVLLVNLLLYINNRYNPNVGAAFWQRCRCVDGVWVGESCPLGIVNRRCDFIPRRVLTVTPKVLPTVNEPTLPPIRPIRKPTIMISPVSK